MFNLTDHLCLGQVVLSALQSKLISEADLQMAGDTGQIETLWHRLIQHEQLKLIDRNLRLKITHHDIYFIVDKIFTRIQ